MEMDKPTLPTIADLARQQTDEALLNYQRPELVWSGGHIYYEPEEPEV